MARQTTSATELLPLTLAVQMVLLTIPPQQAQVLLITALPKAILAEQVPQTTTRCGSHLQATVAYGTFTPPLTVAMA